MLIEITDLSVQAEGIGHIEGGKAVFVPGTLPGDLARIEIAEDRGRFAKGRLISIEEASPDRIEPACKICGECGGCPLMSLSYEAQLRWKEKKLRDALTRIAGIEVPLIRRIIASPLTQRYRNKASFALEGNRAGYRARGSHRLVEPADCLLIGKDMTQAVKDAAGAMKPSQKYFTGLTVRRAYDGSLMIIKEAGDGSVQADRRILKDHIVTDMGTLETEVSPLSFYQVNPSACSLLYSKVQEYAEPGPGDTILDLYCGAGSIGLSMAGSCARVIGVESVKPAVIDANRNAVINGIVNAVFICGKAEEVVYTKLQGIKADIVILDPPRAGCRPELLKAVADIAPRKLVYVSCEPSTLCRDIKILMSYGFEFAEATPTDMFPNSIHIETIVLLQKSNS
ncbi:MAG: class I SAM-dependent RNA methyltransferase [Firmicutes bacterium]|nr:class I SAM-dependent RNA methyltransferase [Bacillota bacterium]